MPSTKRVDCQNKSNGGVGICLQKDEFNKKRKDNGGLKSKLDNGVEDGVGGVPPMAPMELFRTRKMGVDKNGVPHPGNEDLHSLASGKQIISSDKSLYSLF